eukprot:6306433-Heterocapsa_arctica.AAC.1
MEEELRSCAERLALVGAPGPLTPGPLSASGPADQWDESVETVGKPESWEIAQKAAQMQEKLQA